MSAEREPAGSEEEVARRLRQAHELLDERPAPSARQAILQAAAAQHAKAPRLAWRWPARPGPWPAWLPPLGAGATLLVGLFAIGLAWRAQHEPPPSAQRAESLGSPAPLPARGSGASQIATSPAPASPPMAPAPSAVAAAPAAAASPPQIASTELGEARPAPASAEQQAPQFEARRLAPAAAPRAALRQAPAAVSEEARAVAASTEVEPSDPQRWLRQVIELRKAHLDAQAELQLRRLRAAYPNLAIPPEALAPSAGTPAAK